MGAAGRNHYPVARADDLRTMAVECGLGDRHPGRHQYDLQRGRTSDDVMGGAQGNGHDVVIEISGLGGKRGYLVSPFFGAVTWESHRYG